MGKETDLGVLALAGIAGVGLVWALVSADLGGRAEPRAEASSRPWTGWELVQGTDGEEAKVFSLMVEDGGPLIFGDLVQVCVASTVYACDPDPPKFVEPQDWLWAEMVVDRKVGKGDRWGFHPVPVPPRNMVWARVRTHITPPSIKFRLMFGGAYGWSMPEESWVVRW